MTDHAFVPLSGSQDAAGAYQHCGVNGCEAGPEEHQAEDRAALSPERIEALRLWLRQPEHPGPCPVCGEARAERMYAPNNGIIWVCRTQVDRGTNPAFSAQHARASLVEIRRPTISDAEWLTEVDRLMDVRDDLEADVNRLTLDLETTTSERDVWVAQALAMDAAPAPATLSEAHRQERLVRIRASQAGVVQPDATILFLLAEVDRLLDVRDDLEATVNRLTLELETAQATAGAWAGERDEVVDAADRGALDRDDLVTRANACVGCGGFGLADSY